MARSSRVDPCLFCGAAPCECNKPARKAPAPRKPRSTPATKTTEPAPVVEQVVPKTPAPKRSALSAMKAQAKPIKKEAETPPSRELPADTPQQPAEPDSTDFDAAIRALAPILHKEELAKYAHIISAQPTLAERRAAWRAKVISTT